MLRKKVILIIPFLFFVLNNCQKNENEISFIKEKNQELELASTYKEAFNSLNEGDPYFAAKKFLESELLYPQSEWAPRSALMASYSFYLQNYYAEAISNLNRYLTTYPKDINLVYAHYLIAICYYESIEDEKRDTGPLIKARDKFIFLIENYPDTEFATDSRFKLDFIQNILASKEMYIGRHYQKKEKWISAINRFKIVIKQYDQTVYVEEALHRLVEVNYKLGLIKESQKFAEILGYNYQSSRWYEQSYSLFNKNYEIRNREIKKDKDSKLIKRFKSIFK